LLVGADYFNFFVVPHQFSQDIANWPENQILIPDWTYFLIFSHPIILFPTQFVFFSLLN